MAFLEVRLVVRERLSETSFETWAPIASAVFYLQVTCTLEEESPQHGTYTPTESLTKVHFTTFNLGSPVSLILEVSSALPSVFHVLRTSPSLSLACWAVRAPVK